MVGCLGKALARATYGKPSEIHLPRRPFSTASPDVTNATGWRARVHAGQGNIPGTHTTWTGHLRYSPRPQLLCWESATHLAYIPDDVQYLAWIKSYRKIDDATWRKLLQNRSDLV